LTLVAVITSRRWYGWNYVWRCPPPHDNKTPICATKAYFIIYSFIRPHRQCFMLWCYNLMAN